jgi:hypothetical protein
MSIQIVEAASKKQKKAFFQFPIDLYKDAPYYVPALMMDELEIFDPKRNPAYEEADTKLFLAMQEGRIVGRIGAILSHAANRKFKTKDLRFCYFDAPDDHEITQKLFDTVEQWASECGMETISGPHGFSSFDKEGMLIEGFEELPTFVTYYNHPYYIDLVEKYGFRKHFDFVEYCVENTQQIKFPDKLNRVVQMVKKRGHFTVLDFPTKKSMKARAPEIFHLFDEAYEELDDIVPLSTRTKEYLVDKFIPVLQKDLVKVAVNSDNVVVGFMIALPSFSEALRKAKGRLFPFGIWHLWRAMKTSKTLDFVLAGVKKEYRNKGIDLIMAYEMYKTAMVMGFERAESNPELEHNLRIQAEWKYFDPRQHKRRRVYIKEIGKGNSA